MLSELEPYFAKYYDRWLDYSQYICTRFGIRREAYDIMADVLVEFCRKSDEALAELIAREKQWEYTLFMYVIKAIRHRAIDFKRKRRIELTDIEEHTFHLSASNEDEISEELPNAVREAEAKLRDDSLVIPVATSANLNISTRVWFDGRIDRRSGPGKYRIKVEYRAEIYTRGKVIKRITRTSRSATMAAMIQYQMQHQAVL